MPRVTVIMPARNAAEFIDDALNSVIQQTYVDWELVVVDDASSDDTLSRVRAFGDDRIQVIALDYHLGPAAARNTAISAASGELVALLDADDQWLPMYLECQVALFDSEQSKDGRVGLVACDALVLEDGILRNEPYSASAGKESELNLSLLLRTNPIFVSVLMAREVVATAGGFESSADIPEDHDLWIRLAELGYRIVASEQPLAIYRKHAANRSDDWLSMARASQRIYIRALERGNLNRRQRMIARNVLRRHRAVGCIGDILSYPNPRSAPLLLWLRAIRSGFTVLRYALRNPGKWPQWARRVRHRDWVLWRPD